MPGSVRTASGQRWRVVGASLMWLLASGMPLASAQAGEATPAFRLTGTVIGVMDGDTIRLQTGSRQYQIIRLSSIDAPETGNARRPGQPYSRASREALENLAGGKRVTATCYETDAYERQVCEMYLADGTSVNRAMVAAGMAWANQEGRGKFLRDPALPDLEAAAREAGRGLWAQPNAQAPWQWRYRCWRQGQCW